MNLRKKITSFISFMLIIVMTIPSAVASAFEFTPTAGTDENGNAIPLNIYSESVYMINLDTGETLVDIDSERARVPASLTKVMTAVVLLEEFKDNPEGLKTTYVSAGSEAFDELYGTGASTADIQPYEEVSYYDLLAALLIPSSCEAANIIALNLADSISDFCDLMNKKAEELKMTDTHFSNAHGLFADKNYTSCKDMAVLCEYALDNFPTFKEIVAMSSYQMEATYYHSEGTLISNTNYMLRSTSKYYYSYVKGIKTGTLDSAGRCLASYATYDGNTYLIVSMGAPLEKQEEDIAKGEENPDSVYADDVVYYNLIDHINLYEWAFDTLVNTDFINTSSEVAEAEVEFGKNSNYVTLRPAEGYTRLWPTNISTDEVTHKITISGNIVAPIEEGDVLGKMELIYEGEVLTTIDLIATSSVELATFKAKLHVASAFFKSTEFKVALLIIIIIWSVYTIIYVIKVQKKYMK